jgi:predicted metal-binding membrane protein
MPHPDMPELSDVRMPPALPARERAVLWGGLGAITALAWLYLARMPMPESGSGAMADMAAMAMPHRWTAGDAWLTFAMWSVMMVAMMTPSASPMIEMYARIAAARDDRLAGAPWLFAAGYLAAWLAFSAVATGLQFALDRAAMLTGALRVTPLAGGIILVIAGIYQLTPLKSACLAHCRSPIGFFMTEWRGGAAGAFAMGARHGLYCMGCCWMLMGILFAAGVMSLPWVAVIAAFVLVEKLLPWGDAIARAGGAALIGSGIALAALA